MTATGETTEETKQDPDLLYEKEELGCRICLRLANNQMECRADFFIVEEFVEPAAPEDESDVELLAADQAEDVVKEEATSDDEEESVPPPPPPAITPLELINLLHRYNIKQGIDFATLYNFCAAVEERLPQEDILLATGTEPQTGEDGSFELMVKTSGEDAEFQEDEQGRVDLRTRNAFTEIETGQKIGTLHSPQDGIPGQTVHGLPIPAERGKICSLVAGDGVVLKYDGRVAFAEKAGRALLERQVLSVVDEWVISGDVDLAIGNIEYNGFVEIRGDVLDEFNVKASKGIKVGGVVGACRLESDGSVEVMGMAGKERGEVICRGDLCAGFLNQVKVRCHGDVLVKNEIRNSSIKATGRIMVERGAIVGGECVALEGIEAKVLGATSAVATHLTAGIYFPDEDRFSFLRKNLKSIDQQIKRLKAAIGTLEKKHDLNDIIAKRLGILTEQWEKLEVEREQLSSELAASTKQEQKSTNAKINVVSELLEGVHITLGDSSQKFKIERKGPVSIIENSNDGGFRYLSMSPLQKSAAELEKEILLQEKLAAEAAAAAEANALEKSSE